MSKDTPITSLRVEDCFPNPKHYREVREDAVKRLAENIRVAGQLEPIRVWKDANIYFVDAGHHRLAAMKMLGCKTIQAVVVDPSDMAMVASNMHEPETDIEKSRGTQLLFTTGVAPEKVAAVTGISAERAESAAKGLALAKDYAEDMSLDRLAAVSDFEGDEEAVQTILTASEKDWRWKHSNLVSAKKNAARVVELTAIVKAAKVKLLDKQDYAKHRRIGSGDQKPEGAKYAVIEQYGRPDIVWLAESAAADPAEAEKREAAAKAHAEMTAAKEARLAHIAQFFLRGETPPPSLKKVAEDAFDGNLMSAPTAAHVGSLHCSLCDIKGLASRMTAALLAACDSRAQTLLVGSGKDGLGDDYFIQTDGPGVLRYIETLRTTGYEPNDTEAERIKALKAAVKPAKKSKKEAVNG